MNIRKLTVAGLLAAAAMAYLPQSSDAQFFGRGRRGGYYGNYGYGGYGYGSPGYYRGSGVYIGVGNGYGYSNYGGYYNTSPSGYYQSGVVNSNSYQSFYPPGNGYQSSDPCCCMADGTWSNQAGTQQSGNWQNGPATGQQSQGSIVVNVPANAELFWNGAPASGSGAVRRFPLPANASGVQRFEARWTGPDGKTVTQTRTIQPRVNESVTVDFNTDPANAAGTGDRPNVANPLPNDPKRND